MYILTSTPCTLVAHHQGVFISVERGLQESAVAVAPNLGAPRWASYSWGRLGGRGTLPHQSFFFLNIMVFETFSGGHFGEDAIFLCHVMLFPHLTLATLSQ
ncbi:uncharacterized protein LOC111728692 [Otolemur garnettii]|uniref:uncharacterized protein LOC111728692 n=1 Tax=Otolemur garnettii TaxID=30611 RepID=UPI000C7E90C3|nr:uncharacterized protein LOC111728692 [Otolemur garnettii]